MALCIYICSSSISLSLQMCFSFAFKQRILIYMRIRTCGSHTMVTETSKTTNFQVCFLYNAFLYWLTNLLITITFLYQQFFQAGENKPTKVYKTFLY